MFRRTLLSAASFSICLALAPTVNQAQTTTPQTVGEPAKSEESGDTVVLTPFVVDSSRDRGYQATTTLAGTRLNTNLRDVGSAIQVVTEQFLKDTGVRNTEELLKYTTSTEVGGMSGNFSGSISLSAGTKYSNETPTLIRTDLNTRVRGLSSADTTMDYFLTDIPWDAYNTTRIEIQRGPNSILFGLGNPSGIINAGLASASFADSHELEYRFDKHGTSRGSFNFNHMLIKNQLALRIAGVDDLSKFQQKPAYRRNERLYAALRYDPAFLNQGGTHTTFKANVETGNINSNNPRVLPPIDRITPWFKTGTYTVAANPATGQPEVTYPNLDHSVYNLYDAWNYLGTPATVGRATGQAVKQITVNGVTMINPVFQPGFSEIFTPGVVMYYDPANPSSSPAYIGTSNQTTLFGIGSNGAIDRSISGIPFARISAVTVINKIKQFEGGPFFAQYRDPSLTDPSVFDFYHQLFDGPTKNEFRKFHAFNLDWNQTFFHNRLGYDLAWNHQQYSDGQNALFNDRTQMITVDLNATLIDGSPNPNAGRPVMYGDLTGGGKNTERTEKRATVFAELRADDYLSKGWLTSFLGRHVFTGLLSQNRYDRENLSWQPLALDQGFSQLTAGNSNLAQRAITVGYYLGGDLRNVASASGLHLQNIKTPINATGAGVSYFDSHWNKPTNPAVAGYVDPAASWTDPFSGAVSTQSENPANYVGWKTYQATVQSDQVGDRTQLTYSATKNRFDLQSKAFVWQGFFFDGLVIPTFGYRSDTNKIYTATAPLGSSNNALRSDSRYNYPAAPRAILKTNIRSWSVVGHAPKFITDRLPFHSTISLTYNQSSNFDPAVVGRVDVLGNGLPPSSGRTQDVGAVLTLLDDRVHFRVTRFHASAINASYSWSGAFWVGSMESRAWVMAKRYQAGLTGQPQYSGALNFLYNFVTAQPNGTFVTTPTDLAKQQASVAAALDAFPTALFTAWQIPTTDAKWDPFGPGNAIDANRPWGEAPAGFTATQDTDSRGYEYELAMNLTKRWTLVANAAHTTAVTNNNLGSLATWIEQRNAVWSGPAGDMPMFYGAYPETVRDQWNQNVWGPYVYQKYLNNLKVPELRPWRFNVVTNYVFAPTSRLKGLNVGGGYNWQDKQAIGFPWTRVPINGVASDAPDTTKPVYGPTDSSVDLWAGYERRLTKSLRWRIQLNVRNAFGQNKLIPISVNPDGSFTSLRIKEGMAWTVTNRLTF